MSEAPIITSSRELIWIYIPVPKEATALEIEKHIRDNAYTIAIQVTQKRDEQKRLEDLMETDEGSMIQ